MRISWVVFFCGGPLAAYPGGGAPAQPIPPPDGAHAAADVVAGIGAIVIPQGHSTYPCFDSFAPYEYWWCWCGCPNIPPAPNADPLLEAVAYSGAGSPSPLALQLDPEHAGMTGASPPLPWLSPLSLGWVWYVRQFLCYYVFLAAEWMMAHC
jgi:hypothetical protein